MNSDRNHELLSYGDALFLYLERMGMPLNVAVVAQFEGEIALDDCIAFVESKLPLLPRYRQRVVMPPLNVGLPFWEYDPKFDIRDHITGTTLRRGTQAQLKKLAGDLFSKTMDRSRPLWDFTLVHGLKGRRTGLIVRVHHCLADGISGVGMLATLMDSSPDIKPLPKPEKLRVPKPQDPGSAFMDGVVTSCFTSIQRVLTAQSELLQMAQQLAHAMGNGNEETAEKNALGSHMAIPSADELAHLLPELASPAPRLPFNVVCQGPQRFEWAEIPLHDVKAVKRSHGATVNDVFLTVISAAVRRYAELHNAKTSGRLLRVVVPVSIRGRDNVTELGNRITFLPVSLPFSRSPKRLIGLVRERTTFLKGSHVAELVGFVGTLLGAIPPAVQALLGPIASALPIPAGNIICTQVPGPREPLYLMGHRLLSCYPYVPIGGEFGMNCAVLTYNDVAHFGFSADVHAVPDIAVMPKLLLESFEELKKASGVKGMRPSRARVANPVAPPRVEPVAVKVAPIEEKVLAAAGD